MQSVLQETAQAEFFTLVITVGETPMSLLDAGDHRERCHNSVRLRADGDNVGQIFVASYRPKVEVSSDDFSLSAIETVDIPVDLLSKVRVVASEPDQKLALIWS